jgi:hypothetical protein
MISRVPFPNCRSGVTGLAIAGNPENDGHLSPWQEAVGLGHHCPSHDTGAGGEHRGACRADAVEQGTAEEEDDDLGGDRKRPQDARRAWADSCSAPTDHHKGVVHRMTPKNQRCEQNHLAIERQSQQHSDPASLARRGLGVATCRQ